jgi:hypothetical protein
MTIPLLQSLLLRKKRNRTQKASERLSLHICKFCGRKMTNDSDNILDPKMTAVFDKLVELVPAKFYFGTEEEEPNWVSLITCFILLRSCC